VGDIIDLATAMDVITKRGAFFSYNDMRLGQGRENAKEFLKQNIEMCNEIEKTVREHSMAGEMLMDFAAAEEETTEDIE
jgi:recombination protein RecA